MRGIRSRASRGSAAAAACAMMLAGCGGGAPVAKNEEKAGGPPKIKILHFYASPLKLESGSPGLICYGVENVDTVRVEPDGPPLAPSLNRCFSVMPKKTTTYTLHVIGSEGQQASQALTIEVFENRRKEARKGSLILLFTASANEVTAGQPVTICFSAPKAASVRIDPGGRMFEQSPRTCFTQAVTATTTYTMTAKGMGGEEERETLRIVAK